MKSNHLIKIIIFLSICSLVLLAAYFFLFMDIKKKNENISEQMQYLSSEISREDYAVTTQKLLDGLKSDISRIKSSIVPVSGEVVFIEGLEAIARQNNLTINIDSIVVDGDQKNSSTTITTLKIKASTKGSWTNTYKFISQLEFLPYKIKLNSLVLSKADDVGVEAGALKVKNPWQTSFEINVLKYK